MRLVDGNDYVQFPIAAGGLSLASRRECGTTRHLYAREETRERPKVDG